MKYAHNSLWRLHFRIPWTLLSTPEDNFGVYFTVPTFMSWQPTQFCTPANQPTQTACICPTVAFLILLRCPTIYDRSVTVSFSVPVSVHGYTHTWYSKCTQEPLLVMDVLSQNTRIIMKSICKEIFYSICSRDFSIKMVVAAWTEKLWNCKTSTTFTEDRNAEGMHYTCEINSHPRLIVWKETI